MLIFPQVEAESKQRYVNDVHPKEMFSFEQFQEMIFTIKKL
jgi:hypothetical protein